MGIVVLWFVFLLSLGVWVGGAVTGQVMIHRARTRGDLALVAGLTREVAWIIARLYIPVGVIALFCGLCLVALAGVSFLSWWVVVPLLVYLGVVVVGGVYSLPEYRRLNSMFAERGSGSPEAHRRLIVAAWVNRVELAIVLLAFFGIVAGVLTER